jgi:hypothetical protein
MKAKIKHILQCQVSLFNVLNKSLKVTSKAETYSLFYPTLYVLYDFVMSKMYIYLIFSVRDFQMLKLSAKYLSFCIAAFRLCFGL